MPLFINSLFSKAPLQIFLVPLNLLFFVEPKTIESGNVKSQRNVLYFEENVGSVQFVKVFIIDKTELNQCLEVIFVPQ